MKFIRMNAGKKSEVIELKGEKTLGYKKMKELLGFDSPVTVIERKIGNKYYDIWVDDEGLLKDSDERIVSGVLVDERASEYIIGNALILKHDKKGNSIGLTDEEIAEIQLPFNTIDNDSFSDFNKDDKNKDRHIYGYFDDGYIVTKAHSNWLMYRL